MRIRLQKGLTRRDQCYLIGQKIGRLTPAQAATAWKLMAHLLEKCGDKDIPKFRDLFLGIVAAANVATESPKRSESLTAAQPGPTEFPGTDALDTLPATAKASGTAHALRRPARHRTSA